MAELKIEERELTTAHPASFGVAHEQPDGPMLLKGTELGTPHKSAAVSAPMPLFSESVMADFRSQ